jgi:hypothetical protein
MMTCCGVTAASEAKVEGFLATKIHTSRLSLFLDSLLIAVLRHFLLECNTAELSSSLFPKLYRSVKFKVRDAGNISQFKPLLKSSLLD